MKRLIPFLVLAAMIAGCKLENPLTNNTDQPVQSGAGNLPQVAAIAPPSGTLLSDDDPNTQGISATIEVTFSDFMDEATLTSSNVLVRNTTLDLPVSGIEITYNAPARKLYIRNQNWPQSSEYLLTLATSGIKNRFGSALDGNGNGRNDGGPYDDFLAAWYVWNGNSTRMVATQPPTIWRISPDTVRLVSLMPLIQIDFAAAMDTTTLKTAGNRPGNFTLTQPDGNALTCTLLTLTPATIIVKPNDSLRYGRTYHVTLKCGQIKASYPARTPDYVKVLDGNGNGAEANEPDFVWYFAVDTMIPPQVGQVTRLEHGVRFDFTKLMDTLFLQPLYVQVYDNDGYVPGSRYMTYIPGSDPLQTRLECYFSRPTSGSLQVRVARLVRDSKGLQLDSNGNGIGGEPGDDYLATVP
jgi:hypothetical protein